MKFTLHSIGFLAASLTLIGGNIGFMQPAKADLWCWAWESNCQEDGQIGTSGNNIFGSPKQPRSTIKHDGGASTIPSAEDFPDRSLEDPDQEMFGDDPIGDDEDPFYHRDGDPI